MHDAPSDERRVREITTVLEAAFGSLEEFHRYPSPFEGRPFYNVARFTVGGVTRVVKWDTPANAANLAVEHAASAFLSLHNFVVAAPYFFDPEAPLLVSEYLIGHELTEAECTPERLTEIGVILARLHTLNEADLDTPRAIPRSAGKDFQDEVHILFSERLEGSGTTLSEDERRSAEAHFPRLLASAVSTYPGRRGLCRRDMHPGNWLLLESGSIAMIDHAMASFRDVFNDLQEVRRSLTQKDPAKSAAFVAGYGDGFFAATTRDLNSLHTLLHGLGILAHISREKLQQPMRLERARNEILTVIASAQERG